VIIQAYARHHAGYTVKYIPWIGAEGKAVGGQNARKLTGQDFPLGLNCSVLIAHAVRKIQIFQQDAR
jgi:hypothetical protein